ncbi:MAG TPA: ATP-binding protein [Rugosimonospora sp.]|nr:ATP-binding protein [Rugosimonospora sp.]
MAAHGDEALLTSTALRDQSALERIGYTDHLLDAVTGLSADAVVVTGPEGTVRRWNAAAERLYGYRADEIVGHPLSVLKSEPGPGGPDEVVRVRKDGSRVRVAVRRRPVTDDGAPDLVELSRPESLDADDPDMLSGLPPDSLGRLAGGIAHTFNNLLAIIAAHASMLEEELSERSGESAQADVWLGDITHIQRAVDRAAAQTRQLLTFGRRAVAQPVPLDPRHLLGQATPLLRSSLTDAVQLRTGCADGVWPVSADPGQLQQLLLNLVANACEAMPHGGRVEIRADNAEPADLPGRWVRVQVADTGAGMPPDVLGRAFEPFFSTKPPGEGSGMGLAIVRAVVAEAGGRVGIESAPGAGTTVTVLLPATDEQPAHTGAAEAVAAGGHAPLGGGHTLLLIEDEDDLRGAVQRMLANSGYQILVATDGMAAIRIAATHQGPVDVLLSDVVMPEMSGPEVAEEIRAIRPAVRVLFMSGYDQSFLASRGRVGKGAEVMQKPFSREALLHRLREVLAG